MILYASCIGPGKKWPDSVSSLQLGGQDEVLGFYGRTGICGAYNDALHRASQVGAEALVLMHDDTVITDEKWRVKLLGHLSKDIGVIGVVGANGVTGLDWWSGEIAGRVDTYAGVVSGSAVNHDVDAVDGLLMVVLPKAYGIRFDGFNFPYFHGYDVDYCHSVRAEGLRVVTRDLSVIHKNYGGYGNKVHWDLANLSFKEKWN